MSRGLHVALYAILIATETRVNANNIREIEYHDGSLISVLVDSPLTKNTQAIRKSRISFSLSARFRM